MEDKTMKIMSYNTLHCMDYPNRRIDFEATANVIKKYGADIVGLNEMRGEGTHRDYTAQTEKLSELTGMEHYYFAKAIDLPAGPYGNAFLSKYPIKSVKTVPVVDPKPEMMLKQGYESRCLLVAELECGLRVLVIHFGLNRDEQENALKVVLENIRDEKCILMGDFNIRPDNDLLLPIKERMKDTADYFEKPLYSYPSDAPRVKIDYIFVSPDIEVVSADIPEIEVSDHRPHIAEIK